MTRKNKVGIVGGTIWSILDNAAAQAITFVVFVILARFLDAGIYGMLAISVLVIQFLELFFSIAWLRRFLERSHQQKKTIILHL